MNDVFVCEGRSISREALKEMAAELLTALGVPEPEEDGEESRGIIEDAVNDWRRRKYGGTVQQ